MLKTLIKKEITETILDLRFTIATLLCVVLIPLGMYVSRKDYEQRLEDYQRAKQIYEENYGKRVGYYLNAEGYRPPSLLSVFALGLEYFIQDKAVTSHEGILRTSKESCISNPQSVLFGRSDLLFNVSFVVSLAVLICTFNSISGEKENGTLRLMISNSIPRNQIILSKIAGSYITILIPFVIALLIALIILDASADMSITLSQLWPRMLVIVLITFLFILAIVTLSVCISTLTHNSMTSVVVLLFVWAILVFGIPKVSPMIAEVIRPTESQGVVNLRKQILREDLKYEFWAKRTELFAKCLADFAVPLPEKPKLHPETEAEKKAYAQYDSEALALKKKYEKRTADEIIKIEQDHRNKKNAQASIATNLSRISPVCCYTYLVSELSGTGITEPDNFIDNARSFQDQVKRTIYDNYIDKTYSAGSMTVATNEMIEGFDPTKVPLPEMHYRYANLDEALQAGWVDILLLFLFNILFFAVAFLRFGKYDVR